MTINDVRGALKGRVLLPEDDGVEQAATAWNLTVRQPVAAVVEAADTDDVAALVRYARRAGLTVVRAEERVVRVGAGARWGQVQAAAGPLGLAGLSGSAPGVGVTGYTLGGGVGWFSRKHGLASGSVRAIDIVDADGEPGRVTAESDPELFWALRGGGRSSGPATRTTCSARTTQCSYRSVPSRSRPRRPPGRRGRTEPA